MAKKRNIITWDYSHLVSLPANVSSLVRANFALLGERNTDLLSNYTIPLQSACSCDIGCRTDCCVDFALKCPWTCVKEHYQIGKSFSSHDSYLAIGGCLEKHESVEYLCITLTLLTLTNASINKKRRK